MIDLIRIHNSFENQDLLSYTIDGSYDWNIVVLKIKHYCGIYRDYSINLGRFEYMDVDATDRICEDIRRIIEEIEKEVVCLKVGEIT